MVWYNEAFADLSSMTQQIMKNPFDCTNGCDLTILYAIIIGSVITTILISIQLQLAREQFSIRNIVAQTKLRNDVYSLLTQMRMLQPIVYEKRMITPQNRKQVEYVAKTLKELEMDLLKLDGIIDREEKEKIYQMIERVKKRLTVGSSDFGKYPHRFQNMDFSESIEDLSLAIPLLP